MLMKNVGIIRSVCLIALMAAMVGCNNKKQEMKQQAAVVKIDTIRLASATHELQFPGRVVAAMETNVSFKVAGTLKKVYVREGDPVRKGQLLAELDASDYQVQLNATEAEYAQIKADAERVMGLYADGGTTASNYDKARYGLQQIEMKLQNHRNQLAYTRIYSNVNGSVQTRFFDGGETVGAGMPILSLIEGGNLEVEINLPPSSYMNRNSFETYSCTCDVLPGETLPLQLVSVLPRANSNQLYTMRLRLPQGTHSLAAGMTAWVTILTSADGEATYIVPTTALLDEKGTTNVYAYNDQSQTVKSVHVEVLRMCTDGTAIVRGALEAGGMVVSSGIHHISNGEKVQPLEKSSDTNVGGLL